MQHGGCSGTPAARGHSPPCLPYSICWRPPPMHTGVSNGKCGPPAAASASHADIEQGCSSRTASANGAPGAADSKEPEAVAAPCQGTRIRSLVAQPKQLSRSPTMAFPGVTLTFRRARGRRAGPREEWGRARRAACAAKRSQRGAACGAVVGLPLHLERTLGSTLSPYLLPRACTGAVQHRHRASGGPVDAQGLRQRGAGPEQRRSGGG